LSNFLGLLILPHTHRINTTTPTKQKTPVQELIERGIIKQPIFTAKLDKGGTESFYTFGYIPRNILPASSHIIYTDVDSSHGFWEFGSPQLRVGRKAVNRRQGNTAIADTGKPGM
jgi:Eukaryotic aspartyl protease